MTDPTPDQDQDAAAVSTETLNHLLHLGHHDDAGTLFDTVTGLDKAELERVVIAAVGVLTDREVLDRYRDAAGWTGRRPWSPLSRSLAAFVAAWVVFLAYVAVHWVGPLW